MDLKIYVASMSDLDRFISELEGYREHHIQDTGCSKERGSCPETDALNTLLYALNKKREELVKILQD